MTSFDYSVAPLSDLTLDNPEDYTPEEGQEDLYRHGAEKREQQLALALLAQLAVLREAVPTHLVGVVERIALLHREHRQACADFLDIEIRVQALAFRDGREAGGANNA